MIPTVKKEITIQKDKKLKYQKLADRALGVLLK